MKKRTLTSVFIVIGIALFCYLKTIDYKFFALFLYGISLTSTYELLRAYGEEFPKKNKIAVAVYTALIIPLAVFLQGVFLPIFAFLIFAVLTFSAFTGVENDLPVLTKTAFALIYPTLPILCALKINEMGSVSLYIIVSLFAITTFTDAGAYLIGSLLKGKKLCPKLSPNKTVSGVLGGVLGGVVGAFTVYFVFKAVSLPVLISEREIDVIFFIIAWGVVASICTEIGDLFESYIKRKLLVKDMGNMFPGHGGMLDRIDGFSFSTMITLLIYSFLF